MKQSRSKGKKNKTKQKKHTAELPLETELTPPENPPAETAEPMQENRAKDEPLPEISADQNNTAAEDSKTPVSDSIESEQESDTTTPAETTDTLPENTEESAPAAADDKSNLTPIYLDFIAKIKELLKPTANMKTSDSDNTDTLPETANTDTEHNDGTTDTEFDTTTETETAEAADNSGEISAEDMKQEAVQAADAAEIETPPENAPTETESSDSLAADNPNTEANGDDTADTEMTDTDETVEAENEAAPLPETADEEVIPSETENTDESETADEADTADNTETPSDDHDDAADNDKTTDPETAATESSDSPEEAGNPETAENGDTAADDAADTAETTDAHHHAAAFDKEKFLTFGREIIGKFKSLLHRQPETATDGTGESAENADAANAVETEISGSVTEEQTQREAETSDAETPETEHSAAATLSETADENAESTTDTDSNTPDNAPTAQNADTAENQAALANAAETLPESETADAQATGNAPAAVHNEMPAEMAQEAVQAADPTVAKTPPENEAAEAVDEREVSAKTMLPETSEAANNADTATADETNTDNTAAVAAVVETTAAETAPSETAAEPQPEQFTVKTAEPAQAVTVSHAPIQPKTVKPNLTFAEPGPVAVNPDASPIQPLDTLKTGTKVVKAFHATKGTEIVPGAENPVQSGGYSYSPREHVTINILPQPAPQPLTPPQPAHQEFNWTIASMVAMLVLILQLFYLMMLS